MGGCANTDTPWCDCIGRLAMPLTSAPALGVQRHYGACLTYGQRKNRGKCRIAHTRASVVGVSVDPSVVGRDWSPVSSNKARGVTAVELQAATEPHCSRGVQPGGI
jgi:hypothetical protein